jgi:hypothetical protein
VASVHPILGIARGTIIATVVGMIVTVRLPGVIALHPLARGARHRPLTAHAHRLRAAIVPRPLLKRDHLHAVVRHLLRVRENGSVHLPVGGRRRRKDVKETYRRITVEKTRVSEGEIMTGTGTEMTRWTEPESAVVEELVYFA